MDNGEYKMKYYSTWQEALIDFIKANGAEYDDSYNLMADFEQELNQNLRGTYFLRTIK